MFNSQRISITCSSLRSHAYVIHSFQSIWQCLTVTVRIYSTQSSESSIDTHLRSTQATLAQARRGRSPRLFKVHRASNRSGKEREDMPSGESERNILCEVWPLMAEEPSMETLWWKVKSFDRRVFGKESKKKSQAKAPRGYWHIIGSRLKMKVLHEHWQQEIWEGCVILWYKSVQTGNSYGNFFS